MRQCKPLVNQARSVLQRRTGAMHLAVKQPGSGP